MHWTSCVLSNQPLHTQYPLYKFAFVQIWYTQDYYLLLDWNPKKKKYSKIIRLEDYKWWWSIRPWDISISHLSIILTSPSLAWTPGWAPKNSGHQLFKIFFFIFFYRERIMSTRSEDHRHKLISGVRHIWQSHCCRKLQMYSTSFTLLAPFNSVWHHTY